MLFTGGQTSTYLIITESQVMRADARGNQLTNLTKEARPVGTTLPIAVELACGLTAKKPAQRTYVISDDFWTGVVDLDERSIYGLQGEELEQMLRFETESLSNLDPGSSRLGYVELESVPPDTRRFWGAGVPSEILSGVAQAVRVRGGKLELLANPIGLSSPDRSGVPWVEFTSDLAGAFAAPAESGSLPRAYVTRRSTTSDRWYDALGTLFGGKLPEIGWQTTPDDKPPAYTGQLESFSDEPVLERWLEGVAERTSKPEGFPHILAPQAQTSSRTLALFGAALAMITVLICGTLVWTLSSRISSMQAQIDKESEPVAKKKQLDETIKKIKTGLEELVVKADEATLKRGNLRLLIDQSDRFSVLLSALHSQTDTHLVLDKISPNIDGIELSGRAIRSDAATTLVQRLEPLVARVGWMIRPPSVSGSNKTTGGGPWDYTIQLSEMEQIEDQDPEIVLTSAQKQPTTTSQQKGGD